MKGHLTPAEMAVVEQLGECWNAFAVLPRAHPSDAGDFIFHIHALQSLVMARAAMRAHPDVFLSRVDDEQKEPR